MVENVVFGGEGGGGVGVDVVDLVGVRLRVCGVSSLVMEEWVGKGDIQLNRRVRVHWYTTPSNRYCSSFRQVEDLCMCCWRHR